MVKNETHLVEKLKGAATRVGTQGVRVIVEGTVAAVKAVDRLQELLPKRQRVVRVKREPAREATGAGRRPVEKPALDARARAIAARVQEEARAVKTRIKEARPAQHPLKVQNPETREEAPDAPGPQATPTRKVPRTAGRKARAVATAAPKRTTARKDGFKAKRGQKHRH